MDNIDLFVDHFVIHSESREALILNGSREQFESRLRELVQEEVKEILMLKVRELSQQRDKIDKLLTPKNIKKYKSLTYGINTLKELHEDLDFWEEEYKEYQDLLREQA